MSQETVAEMMGWTLHDPQKPHIKFHENLMQHSEEWLAARCGLLTASEMKHIITPSKLAYAKNEKERAHVYEIASQRINQYVEPSFQSFDMARGVRDEAFAAQIYNEKYAPLVSCGFITNDKHGFVLGYSPDGLTKCGEGQIEIKSRAQKYQLETIIEDSMPPEYLIQVQAGLIVSERKWCDFISYCGGMPMFVKRILPDDLVQAAIINAAATFHERLDAVIAAYNERLNAASPPFQPTERTVDDEISAS